MLFTLRPWTLADLPHLVHHANDWEVARYLIDAFPHPYTEADGQAYLAFATSPEMSRCIFAIEVAGQAVGSIALHPQADIHRRNAELGYWLARPFWGQGISTQAVRQMVDYGFETFALTRIFARPFGTNHASHRVLEKAGFTLEARFPHTLCKNGKVLDEWVYGVRRTGHSVPA
ncbi:GNAT family N-acetyltransferase [Hymenobacter sp. BT507]|uniref:GNAT family N-acetyltransferase n=1 Tax=Hymenobacter citatus TaxID=2763506 RepID=A0ABR7MR13_9BACT|nr:GNAT family N-acetyltransferase [Hymenobacter citatus]MBC6613165.1 GNAT family N-acetyltransferase [Hymenobacter citatus]